MFSLHFHFNISSSLYLTSIFFFVLTGNYVNFLIFVLPHQINSNKFLFTLQTQMSFAVCSGGDLKAWCHSACVCVCVLRRRHLVFATYFDRAAGVPTGRRLIATLEKLKRESKWDKSVRSTSTSIHFRGSVHPNCCFVEEKWKSIPPPPLCTSTGRGVLRSGDHVMDFIWFF